MAPYRYSHLTGDEIRLLRLSPRCSGTVRIRIEVKKLSVSGRPQYEALSYVWGSQESPSEITVKDIGKNKKSEHALKKTTPGPGTSISSHPIRPSLRSRSGALFQQAAQRFRSKVSLSITANLAQALPYLQLEEEERVLWIDAICIDQDNPTERGQQVGRMADIYKMADRVVIWLGPADQYTQLALKTVDGLAAEIDVNFVTEEISERSEGSISPLPYDKTTGESLISLFQRPWFERLWIWQEVHARPDNAVVLMGDYSIMWKKIRKFLIYYNSRSRGSPTKLQTVLTQALKLSRSAGAGDLITLLLSTTHCKCTDDRDRIFALLGILEPWERLNIEPDYTKSAADVFKQVVLQELLNRDRLDVLRHCDMMHKSDGMPSWVPRWSKQPITIGWGGRASSRIPAEAEYDGKGTLRVSGVEFGVVTSIQALEHFEDTNNKEEVWSSFVSMFFSLLPTVERSDELDPTMELMMRTLCWNSFMVPYEALQSVSFSITQVKESLLRWREYLAEERPYHGVCERPPVSTGDWYFRRSVQEHISDYSLFRITEGHLGLGPRLAAQGDKVCVVLGCDAPLVLRLVSDDQWSILGDCYVHYIMDGSALLYSLPDNFQLNEQMNPRTGSPVVAFRNMQTDDIQLEDPRVTEPLPAGWEVMEHEDESYEQLFGNKEQNLRNWDDPRLTPDALRARGVKLKTFNLV